MGPMLIDSKGMAVGGCCKLAAWEAKGRAVWEGEGSEVRMWGREDTCPTSFCWYPTCSHNEGPSSLRPSLTT